MTVTGVKKEREATRASTRLEHLDEDASTIFVVHVPDERSQRRKAQRGNTGHITHHLRIASCSSEHESLNHLPRLNVVSGLVRGVHRCQTHVRTGDVFTNLRQCVGMVFGFDVEGFAQTVYP